MLALLKRIKQLQPYFVHYNELGKAKKKKKCAEKKTTAYIHDKKIACKISIHLLYLIINVIKNATNQKKTLTKE